MDPRHLHVVQQTTAALPEALLAVAAVDILVAKVESLAPDSGPKGLHSQHLPKDLRMPVLVPVALKHQDYQQLAGSRC